MRNRANGTTHDRKRRRRRCRSCRALLQDPHKQEDARYLREAGLRGPRRQDPRGHAVARRLRDEGLRGVEHRNPH
eukprot:2462129-Alexandrium_andersonii.AAC.1